MIPLCVTLCQDRKGMHILLHSLCHGFSLSVTFNTIWCASWENLHIPTRSVGTKAQNVPLREMYLFSCLSEKLIDITDESSDCKTYSRFILPNSLGICWHQQQPFETENSSSIDFLCCMISNF